MNWPLIILGTFPIIIFVREGAKRKIQGNAYWLSRKPKFQKDLIMSFLGLVTLVGFAMIVFSGGSKLRNLIIAIVVCFAVAPFVAGLTVGPSKH